MAKEPRVVAELGRPETPEEAAARRAENTRLRRERQTPRNLVASLLASLVVVLVIVLIVPRSNDPIPRDVDVPEIAAQAQLVHDEPLAVPQVPEGWEPNDAGLRDGADGVESWYVGHLTPSDEFLGMYQGLDANPSWVSDLLADTLPTTTTTIDGVEWTVYDNRESDAELGNARYGLVTEAGSSTFVLLGTADPEEFATFASLLVPTIEAQS